jgi:hypothetical protein
MIFAAATAAPGLLYAPKFRGGRPALGAAITTSGAGAGFKQAWRRERWAASPALNLAAVQ